MIRAIMLTLSLAFAPSMPDFEPSRWAKYLGAIAQAETGNRAGKVGRDGERTRYQLSPVAVDEYNRVMGSSYRLEALTDWQAAHIVCWTLERNYKRLDYLTNDTMRELCAVSCYNLGLVKTRRGWVGHDYTGKVAPEKLAEITNAYQVIWKGRKIAKIKGAEWTTSE